MRRLQRLRMQLLSSRQLASDFLSHPAQLTRAPTDILSRAAQAGCLRAASAAASAASAARLQPAPALPAERGGAACSAGGTSAGNRRQQTYSLSGAGCAAAGRPASTAAGAQSGASSSQAAAAAHGSGERAQPGACAAAHAAPRAHAGAPAAEAEKAQPGACAAAHAGPRAHAGAPAAEAEKEVRESREALLRRLGIKASALATRVQRHCLLHARTDAGFEALIEVPPWCTFLACAMRMVNLDPQRICGCMQLPKMCLELFAPKEALLLQVSHLPSYC